MKAGILLFAGLFIVAGSLHFCFTDAYLRTMPPHLPAPRLLVQVSGLFEILGGVGLLYGPTRRFSAWGLFALLLAVSPANVQMAIDHARWPAIPVWALWLRVPLQLPLLWWAWWCARTWPRPL